MDFGQRAGGPWLGFLMGWSMLLECVFGGIATALAAGGYVAFLVGSAEHHRAVALAAGLACVAVFFLLQVWGVREQARALILMTWAALGGLVIFWVAAATNFSWQRVWTAPVLPAAKGWQAVLDAMPYALWWLIIIEGAALAAEQSREPKRCVPRGLTWAVLTTVVLTVLTTVTACGSLDYEQIATRDGVKIAYPLSEVLSRIPARSSRPLLYGFSALALFGLVASYHGLLYGSGRQAFALGRAGWLPRWLSALHATRQTPVAALAACSVVTAAFVVANYWYDEAIEVAVLTAGFAALVLYVLSMASLWVLRQREPELFRDFRAPLRQLLPVLVVALSALGLLVFPRLGVAVVVLSVALYAAGAGYFWWWTRKADGGGPRASRLERLTGCVVVAVVLALVAVCYLPAKGLTEAWLAAALLGLLACAVVLVGLVALRHTR
jgi:ethanolamine permease